MLGRGNSMEFEVNRVRGEKRKGKQGGAENTVWACYIELDFKFELGQLKNLKYQ
jgi:hypothetical protein